MASASAIRDGCITNLLAASVIGPGQVSPNYAVMESTSACCGVVNVTGFVSEAMTFGNNREGTATILAELKLKDTGDPVSLIANVPGFIDKVIASLESDDTLQGTVKAIDRIEASWDPHVVETLGSVSWLPVDVLITAEWFDD
jgi:hypothetical protein